MPIEGVHSVMWNAKGVPQKSKTKLQARRVAWRIIKDWLEAQLALYQPGQAEMAEVFLPYAIAADGRSAYQIFKESHVKQLNAAPDNILDFKAINE